MYLPSFVEIRKKFPVLEQYDLKDLPRVTKACALIVDGNQEGDVFSKHGDKLASDSWESEVGGYCDSWVFPDLEFTEADKPEKPNAFSDGTTRMPANPVYAYGGFGCILFEGLMMHAIRAHCLRAF